MTVKVKVALNRTDIDVVAPGTILFGFSLFLSFLSTCAIVVVHASLCSFVSLHLDVFNAVEANHHQANPNARELSIDAVVVREGRSIHERWFQDENVSSRSFSRHRPLRSPTSESEDMNDNLDHLLLSNFQQHRYTINYISNRDLLRL